MACMTTASYVIVHATTSLTCHNRTRLSSYRSLCNPADYLFVHALVQCCFAVQLIEDQPCQVPVTDALHFAQQFDATHKLPWESRSQSAAQTGPQAAWPLQSNSCNQPASQDLRGTRQSADQVRRQQKLKQKEKKKKRKRRK